MKSEDLKQRIKQLVELADKVVDSTKHHPGMRGAVVSAGSTSVDTELFHEYRMSSLAFIERAFGIDSTYFKEFSSEANRSTPGDTIRSRGILKAIQNEIEGGWLFTIKGLLSVEIFSDTMDMAIHLLDQGYKDPAAVIIGGVLEQSLRQLCIGNGIEPTTESPKDGRDLPKSSDRMNNELSAAGVYSKLYHKSVTSWLALRNNAAHGHYSEYSLEQVKAMEMGVVDFVARSL